MGGIGGGVGGEGEGRGMGVEQEGRGGRQGGGGEKVRRGSRRGGETALVRWEGNEQHFLLPLANHCCSVALGPGTEPPVASLLRPYRSVGSDCWVNIHRLLVTFRCCYRMLGYMLLLFIVVIYCGLTC